MQKFSDFINEHRTLLENDKKSAKVEEFNKLYEAKLKELGANSIMDLDEDQLETFNSYIKTIKEKLSKKSDDEVIVKGSNDKIAIEEGEDVKDEKSFREYAESVLKKAHGDKYDEEIGKKVIDGIISKVKDNNWGEAIGRLTSGLGK